MSKLQKGVYTGIPDTRAESSAKSPGTPICFDCPASQPRIDSCTPVLPTAKGTIPSGSRSSPMLAAATFISCGEAQYGHLPDTTDGPNVTDAPHQPHLIMLSPGNAHLCPWSVYIAATQSWSLTVPGMIAGMVSPPSTNFPSASACAPQCWQRTTPMLGS